MELLSFGARRQRADVRVSCATATERNSAWFVVEATPELASLPAGVYVLRLQAGSEVRQVKVQKE